MDGGAASLSHSRNVGSLKQGAGSSYAQRLIITVKEARKILGKDAKQLSDSQVEELITLLSSLAEDFLQDNGSKV